jgi:hypothetical protein
MAAGNFKLYNNSANTITVTTFSFTIDNTKILQHANLTVFGEGSDITTTPITLASPLVLPPRTYSSEFTTFHTSATLVTGDYLSVLTVSGQYPDASSTTTSETTTVRISGTSQPDPEVPYTPTGDGGGGGGVSCADSNSSSCSASGSGSGSAGACVVATALTTAGTWSLSEKMELVKWCENALHDTMLGETFRRGYQVIGSKIILPLLFKNGTRWTSKYVEWSFTNATNMLRGNRFNKLSIPNSVVWLAAMTVTGAVVSKRYPRKSWISLYRKNK